VSELHKGRLVTDAILANLTAANIVHGDGVKPAGGGWSGTPGSSTFVGYVVVHPLAGGITDGSLEEPDADAYPIYQMSCYGATRAQCEAVADLVRDVMLGDPLTISGRSVMQVRVDMLGGARRDDELQPPEWFGFDRYRIVTTP
jgi:hypothetical protein